MKLTRAEWLPYFQTLAARMRLGGWEIVIHNDPPTSEDVWASINCCSGRFLGTVRLSEVILVESDENQRYVAVHELVHCYQAHADELVESTLSPDRKEAWSLAAEYGVDAVASTIAQFMPLPSEIVCNSNEPSTPGLVSLPPLPASSVSPSPNSSAGWATMALRSSGRTYQTPRRDARSTRRK